MFKGLALYYILSMLTRNPILALILLVAIYAVADRAYFGFLPDFFGPLKRNARIKNLRSVLELNPANADAAQELGTLYFEKGKYGQALKYLLMANIKVDNSARLYLYLGMSYMELEDAENGKRALDKAVQLDGKVGHGLPCIYLLQYELIYHVTPEVKEELEKGLANFANTENFYRMGMVFKNQGYRGKAKDMFSRAIEEYIYVPKRMRRIHRKWAILSRVQRMLMV